MQRVLITNDDGISADGIWAMHRVATQMFDEVWLVAPDEENSQIGHKVTTYSPITIDQREERVFAVGGTPADCTRVALAHLLPERPDWVWSGINHGGNLGRHDFVISGTMAAVREGAFAGIPGFGVSHYLRRGVELYWEKAGQRMAQAFEVAQSHSLKTGEFWSVNLPHLDEGASAPDVVLCEQEPQPLEVAYDVTDAGLVYTGSYPDRPRSPGTDVDVCFGGNIALSRCSI
ncbi:MAG: 5'/3'-nucleotidase SurE [Verrucomicrobiota bacterium]